MRIVISLCLIFLSLAILAQDAKSDFNKINRMYNTTASLAFDIKYELFFDGAKSPYQTETGKYVKQKDKYFTKQGNSEVVITDSYLFMIDRDAKVVAVDKKIDPKKLANPLSLNLDSLFLWYTKIEPIIGSTPNVKGYRFFISEGPYSACEVLFNTKTNFVTEIRNIFRDKLEDENGKKHFAILKTTFSQTESQSDFAVFDNNKYITKVSQKFVLASQYKSFKFINHLN